MINVSDFSDSFICISRHDFAVEKIKTYIVKSGLKDRDLLPTEKQLEELLHISRTSIREALRSMEALGIIETKQGIGRFLRSYNYGGFVDNLAFNLEINTNTFKEVIDIRIALETQFLEKLFTLYTQEDYDLIQKKFEALKKSFTDSAGDDILIETHTDFHLALYGKAKNSLLLHLIKLFSNFQQTLVKKHQYPSMRSLDFILMHEDLIQALKTRNKEVLHTSIMFHFKEVINWTNSN